MTLDKHELEYLRKLRIEIRGIVDTALDHPFDSQPRIELRNALSEIAFATLREMPFVVDEGALKDIPSPEPGSIKRTPEPDYTKPPPDGGAGFERLVPRFSRKLPARPFEVCGPDGWLRRLGDMVLYCPNLPAEGLLPAFITKFHSEDRVDLKILTPGSDPVLSRAEVRFSETGEPGTWRGRR